MKTLSEIFQQQDIQKIITDLSVRDPKITPWEKLEKDYEPKFHRIADPIQFPDKKLVDENGNFTGWAYISRIMFGMQKLSVKRMSEFMFTIPPVIKCEDAKEGLAAEQFEALKKVLKKNKWNSFNKERCVTISKECECATYWYLDPINKNREPIRRSQILNQDGEPMPAQQKPQKKKDLYGFESEYKLKCTLFSPSKGDKLFPMFDETGDMVAFSRMYVKIVGNITTTFFETWTDEFYIQWKKESDVWRLIKSVDNPIGKIPIIYTRRSQAIWEDADNNKVHEMELLASRNSDILAYHSAPVLLFSGTVEGVAAKGESNRVYQGNDGAKAEYISWDQSPESVRFQFETLKTMYFTELQLPDLSFENLKGMGAASGEARKFMFADAHLKVGDESALYDAMMSREFSVICAFLGNMNRAWLDSIEDLEIQSEIIPFIINDEKQTVEILVAANGNQPIISHEESVRKAALVDDPSEDFKKIQAEEKARNEQDQLGGNFSL